MMTFASANELRSQPSAREVNSSILAQRILAKIDTCNRKARTDGYAGVSYDLVSLFYAEETQFTPVDNTLTTRIILQVLRAHGMHVTPSPHAGWVHVSWAEEPPWLADGTPKRDSANRSLIKDYRAE